MNAAAATRSHHQSPVGQSDTHRGTREEDDRRERRWGWTYPTTQHSTVDHNNADQRPAPPTTTPLRLQSSAPLPHPPLDSVCPLPDCLCHSVGAHHRLPNLDFLPPCRCCINHRLPPFTPPSSFRDHSASFESPAPRRTDVIVRSATAAVHRAAPLPPSHPTPPCRLRSQHDTSRHRQVHASRSDEQRCGWTPSRSAHITALHSSLPSLSVCPADGHCGLRLLQHHSVLSSEFSLHSVSEMFQHHESGCASRILRQLHRMQHAAIAPAHLAHHPGTLTTRRTLTHTSCRTIQQRCCQPASCLLHLFTSPLGCDDPFPV